MEEFKISEPNDLAKVDVDEQIEIKGAKNFIRRWYDGSIVQAIQRLYPLAKVDEEFFKKEAEERSKIPKVKGFIFFITIFNFQGARRKKPTPPPPPPAPINLNAPPPSAQPPEKEYPEGHFLNIENQVSPFSKYCVVDIKENFSGCN